uniref:BTB domain-containing protein n=1 Tax=Chromera velia CCMP2878 TaxID=1169474 RepID=A0A0G4HZK2_9ALVE|eukprot:Cvel_9737.t1-p1 / transcript=Cvel_9737.t1 / gene=Cvel_9737 / organism=Chromera_velia_CCMP2878 / gene_product=E3 ubiquitin-protein ligase HECTD1, putative / transcript_product=E3 ubiquitin-protein ligase HECTD1, putative / location=Cvel_scaffold569:28969-33715(-) / protein_length=750 / sequence_SO=supercontig / SO=protein_coding / is_pseudo=false
MAEGDAADTKEKLQPPEDLSLAFFRGNEKLSDVEVSFLGATHKAHKVVLAACADFFFDKLVNAEEDVTTLELPTLPDEIFADPSNDPTYKSALELLLQFAYQPEDFEQVKETLDGDGKLELALATLGVSGLVKARRFNKLLVEFVNLGLLTKDTAMRMLLHACRFDDPLLQETCREVVVENFHEICQKEEDLAMMAKMPVPVVCQVLKHDELSVTEEGDTFTTVRALLHARNKNATDEALDKAEATDPTAKAGAEGGEAEEAPPETPTKTELSLEMISVNGLPSMDTFSKNDLFVEVYVLELKDGKMPLDSKRLPDPPKKVGKSFGKTKTFQEAGQNFSFPAGEAKISVHVPTELLGTPLEKDEEGKVQNPPPAVLVVRVMDEDMVNADLCGETIIPWDTFSKDQKEGGKSEKVDLAKKKKESGQLLFKWAQQEVKEPAGGEGDKAAAPAATPAEGGEGGEGAVERPKVKPLLPYDRDSVHELLGCIRFPELTHAQLLEAARDELFEPAKPKILDALSFRLSKFEPPKIPDLNPKAPPPPKQGSKTEKVANKSPPRQRRDAPPEVTQGPQRGRLAAGAGPNNRLVAPPVGPPTAPPIHFLFDHVDDANGALFFLGTQGGRTLWRNPMSIGQVSAFSSGVGFGRLEDLVGRQVVNLRTRNEEGSFFGVDLLEGSNDGVNWHLLDEQSQSDMLREPCRVAFFPIPPAALGPNPPAGFRLFRVVQVNRNSSGSFNLVLSGMELYGTAIQGNWG